MNTRERAATAVRKSVSLTNSEISLLEAVRSSQQHLEALSEKSQQKLTTDSSESSVLQAVLRVGLITVIEKIEADGYSVMAEQQQEADWKNSRARKATARRRLPTWSKDA